MTQKEMKTFSRKRLLEMLAEQTGRANRLLRENERLKERIAEREQHLAQLGELAETVLNSNSSLDVEPVPTDESAAEASPGFPDPQGDVPPGGQTGPDTVTAEKDEASDVTKAAPGSDDASGKSGGSIVSNIRSTASSLAMLGTAAVLLITKKKGKDP